MHFIMHENGLHYYDPRGRDVAMVQTVSGNKENFTKRQVKGAEAAKALYTKLIFPSWKDFKWIIRSNQIKDCPVTIEDVDNAMKIFGKSVAALKGKTTRTRPIPVARDFVKIPKEILQLHREVFLTADIFFVNKIAFFLTYSRKICFTSVCHLNSRHVPKIFDAFKQIYQYYLQRGFRISTVHVDGEFEALKPLIEALPGGPQVNLAAANEHVPEIERRVRVVKERSRATRHSLPFSRLPKLLIIYIVFTSVKLLNFFPPKGGISETLSPKTIMSGKTLDFKKHLCLQVGAYCQVHEEELPRNSQIARTRGAIALGPSDNIQGGYKFMALDTGKKITRRTWDELPLPDVVIARVNELGKDMPEDLIFTDRKGRLIGEVKIPGVTVEYDAVDVDLTAEDEEPLIEIPGVDPIGGNHDGLPGVDVPHESYDDDFVPPPIDEQEDDPVIPH
jgi:hypothetical protein